MEALDSICCASSRQRAAAVREDCTEEFRCYLRVCAENNDYKKHILKFKDIFYPVLFLPPTIEGKTWNTNDRRSSNNHLFFFCKDCQHRE